MFSIDKSPWLAGNLVTTERNGNKAHHS
uniref:Uncharacterized protein n=1 Tax=Anguilla anguilla TaxID=7936 RepID=A0A0E9R062_ANGAN